MICSLLLPTLLKAEQAYRELLLNVSKWDISRDSVCTICRSKNLSSWRARKSTAAAAANHAVAQKRPGELFSQCSSLRVFFGRSLAHPWDSAGMWNQCFARCPEGCEEWWDGEGRKQGRGSLIPSSSWGKGWSAKKLEGPSTAWK